MRFRLNKSDMNPWDYSMILYDIVSFVYKANYGEISKVSVVVVLNSSPLVCSSCSKLRISLRPTSATEAGRCDALRELVRTPW